MVFFQSEVQLPVFSDPSTPSSVSWVTRMHLVPVYWWQRLVHVTNLSSHKCAAVTCGMRVPVIISYVFSPKSKVYIMKIQYNYTHGSSGLEGVQQDSLIEQAPSHKSCMQWFDSRTCIITYSRLKAWQEQHTEIPSVAFGQQVTNTVNLTQNAPLNKLWGTF